MIALAALIGAGSAVIGLYLSYYYDLASGGLIVMVVTAVFVLCWGGRELKRAPLLNDNDSRSR